MSLSLVTDRSDADLQRIIYLKNKVLASGWGSLTPEESAEWRTNMRGCYNTSDLNRVGNAISYLSELLTGYGYPAEVDPKTDWGEETYDPPSKAQMARYLADIQTLRGAIGALPSTPDVPASMDGLTYKKANDIELILLDVEYLIENIVPSFYFSGDAYAGEGNV